MQLVLESVYVRIMCPLCLFTDSPAKRKIQRPLSAGRKSSAEIADPTSEAAAVVAAMKAENQKVEKKRGSRSAPVAQQVGGHNEMETHPYLRPMIQINGLVQERRNSSALAMELRLSYTNPSKWFMSS